MSSAAAPRPRPAIGDDSRPPGHRTGSGPRTRAGPALRTIDLGPGGGPAHHGAVPGIYVETRIRGPLEEIWQRTQEPALHERWDLRFTTIEYLPRPDPAEPQRFRYATRIGFGLRIEGEGESVGSRGEADGARTSALKFWSDEPWSLIRTGSGYWQYVPTPDGVRFLTWYDYEVRLGAPGRLLDALAFRPLLGWATAWSFDRLRLWIEAGLDPAVGRRQALIHAIARLALATVWIYHGLVPKLLARHPDELDLLRRAGIPGGAAPAILLVLGWAEIGFGAVLLLAWSHRWLLLVSMALVGVAGLVVAVTAPGYLVAAFNPVSLNLLVVALGAVGWLGARDAPSAARCRRAPESP